MLLPVVQTCEDLVLLLTVVQTCEDLYVRGYHSSQVYTVYSSNGKSTLNVFCIFTSPQTGFLFPPVSAVCRRLLDLQTILKTNGTVDSVDIRFLLNGTLVETESVVNPLLSSGPTASLSVGTSWSSPLDGLNPTVVGDYLYVSITSDELSDGVGVGIGVNNSVTANNTFWSVNFTQTDATRGRFYLSL